jgi:hypothetical protein
MTPTSQEEFNETINKGNYTYMVVFSDPAVGESEKRPYFEPYVEKDSLFTVYEPTRESAFTLTSCESIDSWSVARGDVRFFLDSNSKKEGLHSVKVDGMTDKRGQTRVSYYARGTWDLRRNYLEFWFKLDNAVNPSYFSVILADATGNYRYWIANSQTLIDWSADSWHNLQVPLNYYYEEEGEFDLSQVKNLSIYAYAEPRTSITYHIDSIMSRSLAEKVFSYNRP